MRCKCLLAEQHTWTWVAELCSHSLEVWMRRHDGMLGSSALVFQLPGSLAVRARPQVSSVVGRYRGKDHWSCSCSLGAAPGCALPALEMMVFWKIKCRLRGLSVHYNSYVSERARGASELWWARPTQRSVMRSRATLHSRTEL